jgi:hypothetical protein
LATDPHRHTQTMIFFLRSPHREKNVCPAGETEKEYFIYRSISD